ncbi:unnamed protein product [Lepidochelys kempii]
MAESLCSRRRWFAQRYAGSHPFEGLGAWLWKLFLCESGSLSLRLPAPVRGSARAGRQGALLLRPAARSPLSRFHWNSRRQLGAILKPTGRAGRATEGEAARGDWLRLRRRLLSEPRAAAARSGPAWQQGKAAAAAAGEVLKQ